MDQTIQSRKQAIQNQTEALQKRGKQVQQQQNQVQAELEQIFRSAMRKLHDITSSKLAVLKGDEMELKRQHDEISFVDQYLHYQQSGVDAIHLLHHWSHHQAILQELRDFPYFRHTIDVALNLKVFTHHVLVYF